jgi:hypothetical protein
MFQEFNAKIILNDRNDFREDLIGKPGVLRNQGYTQSRSLPEVLMIHLRNGDVKTVSERILDGLDYLSFVFEGMTIGKVKV